MRQPGTPRLPLQEISLNSRSRIVGARDHGISFKAIARMESLRDSTVRTIFKNASHQTSCLSSPRVGRASILTEGDHRNIRRAIIVNPKITAQQLFIECAPHTSKKTIYRYLKKSGIQKWRCKVRPFLTEDHARQRREWAIQHDGEALELWAIQTKAPKGRTQMFWAAFGFGCRSDLVVMQGDQNAKRGGVTAKVYIEVLTEYLPTILDDNSIFMQDNAPIHKAHKVRDFLIELGIDVMVWPPYSPDLNPIENLWKMLKAEIHRAHPELKGVGNGNAAMDHMIICAQEAWETLAPELLNKLAVSMQKRVDAVKASNGWYTKY